MNPTSPIFAYGALRSGTTVFRLMIAAHSRVACPGEADFLFDYLSQGEDGRWAYDLKGLSRDRIFRSSGLVLSDGASDMAALDLLHDLMGELCRQGDARTVLIVHRNIGKIDSLFGSAPLIHIVRDPRDAALSVVGMGWAGSPYFGVDPWLETEREWDLVIRGEASRPVLTLRYEDLIQEFQPTISTVFTFLDERFEERVLHYHVGTTYGPPDIKLIEQWPNRLDRRELALIEGRVGDLLVSRGYRPASPVPAHLGRFSGLVRSCLNDLQVFSESCRRYGLLRLLSERLARLGGFEKWHDRVLAELHAIENRSLK